MSTYLSVIAIVAVAGICASCSRSTNGAPADDTGPVTDTTLHDTTSIASLQTAYSILESDRSDCEPFVEAFPSTFDQFSRAYGYVELGSDAAFGPLYHEALEHVRAFASSTCVDRGVVIGKLIRLASDGSWQADGVNYLQGALIDAAVEEPALFVEAYLSLSQDERAGVMRFAFDGPGGEDRNAHLVRALSAWPDVARDAEAALEARAQSVHR